MARSVDDFIIDFSKEEEAGGGGGTRVPPDTYRVKILAAKTGASEDKGTPYLELTMAFLDGSLRKKKTKISERLYISPKALSRFRLLMEALDIKPPKGKMDLNKLIPKLKGGELYVEIEDDEREGYKTRSRVAFQGFINPEDYDPDADDDLEDEDEDDIEDEDEEEEEEDEDEEEEDEEEEEEPPARKRSRAKSKPAARKRRKPADDDEDEDEDDDEDEEPAPKRKAKAKAKPKRSSKKSKADDEDEEEDLDDLDLDSL